MCVPHHHPVLEVTSRSLTVSNVHHTVKRTLQKRGPVRPCRNYHGFPTSSWEAPQNIWMSSFVSDSRTHTTCFQNNWVQKSSQMLTLYAPSPELMVLKTVFCENIRSWIERYSFSLDFTLVLWVRNVRKEWISPGHKCRKWQRKCKTWSPNSKTPELTTTYCKKKATNKPTTRKNVFHLGWHRHIAEEKLHF